MQFFVLLSLLVQISVYTKAAKPRSINVALDTIFEFDKSSDVDFINQVQGILAKVKNKIKDNPKQDENEYTMRVKQYKFTNFLEDLIDTVLTFNDKDLMEIVQIVKNEIQENKQRDTLQENIRRFLSNELNHIKVKTIRKDLDKLLRKLQNPKKNNNDNILGFINTLYKRDTQEKLSNFIKKLKIFRQRSRKSGQLQHTVRKAVQLIIVDYFSNLSKDTKRKVEDRLKAYLRDDFSVHSGKTYPLKQKQPPKVKIEPELVLQNSEDTNSEETIEIETKDFKSHRNNYKPYLNQDTLENTEVTTKKLAKNEIVNVKQKEVSDEEVISIEKVTKKESLVTSEGRYTNSKYSTDTFPQITYLKPKSHNKKSKGKSKTTKLSTKTYVTNKFLNVKHKNYNEGEAMSIEKEGNDGKSKYIYGDDTPQATYSKPRSHTKKSKKRSKNASIKHSKGKLTHITLYPENIKIKRRNFRALKEDKNNEAKNKRILDAVTLTSISYRAEINVTLKNNKIKFVYDDKNDNVRKYALMKVRAYRQKLMESRTTGDNKDFTEPHSKRLKINRNDIDNTPKPSVAYFGSLFKSKGVTVNDSDSRPFEDSDTDHTHKVIEYFKKIDDIIVTRNTENIDIVTTINTRNKLDEKQRNFIANNDNNYFQEKEDNRFSKQVRENKSAKKLKMIDITTENDLLTTSGYRPKPRQDPNIGENKPDNKFKMIVITTESYDRLAEELNIKENIFDENIKRNEIATKNYEEFEEYNFVENKPERNLTTTEITTGDNFFNNRGFRRTKEPKIIDKVNLNIPRNDINAISKSNKDMDIKATFTSSFDYNMESTTTQKIKNNLRTLPPVTLNIKAGKIINNVNENIVHKIRSDHNLRKSTKTTKKTVENQSTYRKTISEQLTKKIVELPTKFIEKVTKYKDMNKLSKHINLGSDMHEIHDTTKIQSEFTSNNKNNDLKFTKNMNKDSQFKSGDTFKRINTQTINIRRQINVNPEITTKSYINHKDLKPIRNKINDSRKQLNINSKATTVAHKAKELDADFKENNKISTAAVDPISLDPKKVTKNEDDKHNNTKLNDLRKYLKTTPRVVFKDEFLDTEFKEAIKSSEKDPVPIDIQKYIKNPEVADVGDEKKKKEIEQKMKEELSNIFTSPSTIQTTTEAYTDIFEAMDNEFGLGPLK